jgi:hypothetical protein
MENGSYNISEPYIGYFRGFTYRPLAFQESNNGTCQNRIEQDVPGQSRF